MVQFNDHQARLWLGMVKSIHDFRSGKLNYYSLVGSLEAAIDAGEFREKKILEKWYDLWTPLESVRAQKYNDVSVEDVSEYLTEMEAYLMQIIEKNSNNQDLNQ